MQNKADMKDFVISLLKDNLPAAYYYHNYEHSLYVMEIVLEIGRHETCSEDELDLLGAAALWHDTGYITIYRNHEEESCKLARQFLPDFGYSFSDIDKICGMIMATKIPQKANTKLEEILADADLEYLGTDAFKTKADKLFKELQTINPSMTLAEWNRAQISFLRSHHYFTMFCQENKEPEKRKHLLMLTDSLG